MSVLPQQWIKLIQHPTIYRKFAFHSENMEIKVNDIIKIIGGNHKDDDRLAVVRSVNEMVVFRFINTETKLRCGIKNVVVVASSKKDTASLILNSQSKLNHIKDEVISIEKEIVKLQETKKKIEILVTEEEKKIECFKNILSESQETPNQQDFPPQVDKPIADLETSGLIKSNSLRRHCGVGDGNNARVENRINSNRKFSKGDVAKIKWDKKGGYFRGWGGPSALEGAVGLVVNVSKEYATVEVLNSETQEVEYIRKKNHNLELVSRRPEVQKSIQNALFVKDV